MRSLLFFLSWSLLAALNCAHAQSSFFDPTFGTGGKSGISLSGTDHGTFEAIEIQSDDKIIAVGMAPNYGVAFRFKEYGIIDSSFGVDGIFSFPASALSLTCLRIQPDGKIVAGGELNDSFFAVRLQSNGIPDATFGSAGAATIGFGAFTNAHGKTLALQADGKIVMGGECASANIGIARFLANGTPDNSFGTNGVVIGPYGRANAIAVASDGRIIGGGHATASMSYALMAVRYLTDGTLDTSFNHTGVVYTLAGGSSGNFGRALRLQSDGKILLAGSGSFGSEGGNFVVVRYNTDGSLDGSFGSGGIATVDFSGQDDDCWDMRVLSDGKILLAGISGPYEQTKFAVARLTSNGLIDNTFGVGGRVVNAVGIRADYARCTALQSSGKIIVAGNTIRNMTDPYVDPVVVRYLASGATVSDMSVGNIVPMPYPNPTNHFLFIKRDLANQFPQVIFYDVSGREVLSKSIGCDGSINVQQLNDGAYLCKFTRTDGMVFFNSVVIQN